MKTVVTKPYLSYMPEVDDHDDNDTGIRNSFIGAFLDKLKEQDTGKKRKTNQDRGLLKIDYVRLNIRGGK
jgi:hypothetical protein